MCNHHQLHFYKETITINWNIGLIDGFFYLCNLLVSDYSSHMCSMNIHLKFGCNFFLHDALLSFPPAMTETVIFFVECSYSTECLISERLLYAIRRVKTCKLEIILLNQLQIHIWKWFEPINSLNYLWSRIRKWSVGHIRIYFNTLDCSTFTLQCVVSARTTATAALQCCRVLSIGYKQ